LEGNGEGQQVIERPNGNLVNANMEGTAVGIFSVPAGDLSTQQEDGNTSDQEEGRQERDSDFEFVPEDVETDSDSEPDLSLHNDENMDTEDVLDDTSRSNGSVAKAFLESTWSRLCDCKTEENASVSGREPVFRLQQMAEYWQNLGVPDAIGRASLPPEAGEEGSTHLDWLSVLGGGDQRPHLCFEKSQHSTPGIRRTWDVDSIIYWASCFPINRGLYLSYFPPVTRNIRTNVHVFHKGKALHLIPHLRLGSGRQSPEFGVHVFFPGISHACRTTSYLTKDEHRIWIDRLLPAIRHCYALSGIAREVAWLRHLLGELEYAGPYICPVIVNGDNQGSLYLAENPQYHQKTKHIEVQYHYIRQEVKARNIALNYVPTDQMAADGLTKPLNREKHMRFVNLLNMESGLG
jgi:hypothetical protein